MDTFKIRLVEKSATGLRDIGDAELNHIPLTGTYFIPQYNDYVKPYLITAIIHREENSILILEKSDVDFKDIATLPN